MKKTYAAAAATVTKFGFHAGHMPVKVEITYWIRLGTRPTAMKSSLASDVIPASKSLMQTNRNTKKVSQLLFIFSPIHPSFQNDFTDCWV